MLTVLTVLTELRDLRPLLVAVPAEGQDGFVGFGGSARTRGRAAVRGPRYKFEVLFVCTANLCRSPMAEMLLKAGLAERLGPEAGTWEVGSAGVAAHPGSGMHPLAERVLEERGINLEPFERRILDREVLASADLILTAETAHRSAAIRMDPTVAGRSFTVRQFARLCAGAEAIPSGPLSAAGRSLVVEALKRRGQLAVVAPGEDEVEDPFGQGIRQFKKCADALQKAVVTILDPIFPPTATISPMRTEGRSSRWQRAPRMPWS